MSGLRRVVDGSERCMSAARPSWILQAANEIACGFRTTLPMFEVTNIIERLCPFERDVAYIPVPRCDSCRHWSQLKPGQDDALEEHYAAIVLREVEAMTTGLSDETIRALVPKLGECANVCGDGYSSRAIVTKDGNLMTRADFGCVQFEKRAAERIVELLDKSFVEGESHIDGVPIGIATESKP